SCADSTLLNNFEMAAEGNGDLLVPDLRTMTDLCQSYLNGRGGPIASIAIQATNFGLKNDMTQQVHNSCQFHGLSGDDANKHLDKFLHVTQRIKVNGVTDDAFCLYLIPYSLTHHATAWFDRLPRNSISTFEQMAKMFLAWECYKISIDRCPNHNMLPVTQIDTFYNGLTLRHRVTINAAAGGTLMKRRLEECYDLIENMTAHHNDWDTSAQRSESSSSITSFDMEIVALKAKMVEINKNLLRVLQVNQQVRAVTPNYETCGGPYYFNDCPAIVGQTRTGTTREGTNSSRKLAKVKAHLQLIKLQFTKLRFINPDSSISSFHEDNTTSSAGSGTLLGNVITNPKEELKGIITRSGTAYQGPTIPTTSSSPPPVVERETEVTKDMVHPTNNESTKDVQPLIVQTESLILNSEPVVAPIIEPVAAPVSAPKPNQRPLIPYPSRLHDQKLHLDADPRVPLVLGRSFLKTERALIDVFKGELTLRFGKEAITFNLDQTSRYSANYNDMMANRIDVIDMACKEYSQEVLGFSDVIASGNPTPYYDPIVSTTSPTLTSFGNSDFLLEEVDAFLALEDPTSLEVDQSYELKICETKTNKSLIDEPPEVELKDLPPHLEYAFLEGDNKLPVIISKDLSVEEKTAHITVLKSHKRSIAWKLSDIKGIDPEFCTHKILMEEDFEPAVQHQRRVNPKIYDVIKNEVLKLLDAGLIYLISNSPWEKSYFMDKEGIILGHKISKNGIEFDKAKVDVIAKLPHLTTVKGIRSFLGHTGFYR
nr:reverse transcriptase domain-containing protein [Tanacetum cinerariifolium]